MATIEVLPIVCLVSCIVHAQVLMSLDNGGKAATVSPYMNVINSCTLCSIARTDSNYVHVQLLCWK